MRLPPRTFSGIYLRSVVDILAELGLPHAMAETALGTTLHALSDPRERILEAAVIELFAEAERRTGNPLVGLETGHRFRVANFARTGSVLALAPSYREAARVNARYAPLAETVGLSEVAEDGARLLLRWSPDFDAEAGRHITELVLGGYATTVRWLGWAFEGRIPHVALRHARPAPTSGTDESTIAATYRRILQRDPVFGAAYNEVAVPDGLADEELPTHNPEGFERQCRKLDAVLSSSGGEDLGKILLDALPEGVTTKTAFADHIGVKTSELDRKLRRDGTTFRQLLDSVRQEGFDRLAERGVPLAGIAAELGFNDQAAMTRAFKRWHGTTPARYVSAL